MYITIILLGYFASAQKPSQPMVSYMFLCEATAFMIHATRFLLSFQCFICSKISPLECLAYRSLAVFCAFEPV